jgi:hypothetical protein
MSSTMKTSEHIIPAYSLPTEGAEAVEAAEAAAEAAEATAATVCRGEAAASASLEHGSYFPFRDRWSGREPPYLLVGLESAIRLTSGIPWPAVIDIAVGAGYVYFEEEPGPERQPSC